MNLYFKAGENYYTGFQKFNILADSLFRRCVVAFLLLVAIEVPGVKIIPPGMHREIFVILLFLLYMTPAVLVLAGGMSATTWRWYGAAAVFFAMGTIPIALGAPYYFLVFAVPAGACLVKLNRISPEIFKTLGYTTPANPVLEIVLSILGAGVLIAYTFMGQALIRKSGFDFKALDYYLWLSLTSALYYGTLWGILYGLLMRRFLDMRYNIAIPIMVNTLLMSVYWVPSLLGYGHEHEVVLIIVATTFQCFVCHVALGLTYHFCRSTRPLLAAFVIQYLFMKTIIL